MSSRLSSLLTFLAPLAIGGCDIVAPGGGTICTMQAAAAIGVEVVDSVNNTPVGRGAQIVARDGVYADTARFTANDGPYGLAYERAGTYTVSVQQQGYRLWSVSGIKVSRGECHVRAARLTALLQRSAAP